MVDRVQRTRLPATAPASAGSATRGTPESALRASALTARRFALRHRADRPLEWELRLEGETLQVWTLPQGLPWSAHQSRAAVPAEATEAARTLATFDAGRCAAVAEGGEVTLLLEGRRVRGRYALRHDADAGWSLERLDPATVRPMPDRVLPMLARAGSYPADEQAYAFEVKWDGIRALAYVRDGRVKLRSRNLLDITSQYPELAPLADALAGREALLDGEIVALDESGRPSFQRLQGRLGVSSRKLAAARAEEIPALYVVFDVLHLDGQDTTALPYEERRALLESMQLRGERWIVPPVSVGHGRELLAIPGTEGVVAKRLGSPYEPGARSTAWIKVKAQRRQELVIGGFTPGRGARAGRLGALMVGHYDGDRLVYAGNVGTGFSERTLDELERLLQPLARAASPFDGPVDKAGTFVEPRYVAEFEFTEWTRDGRLRHPSFKGLRFDKDPRDVVREEW